MALNELVRAVSLVADADMDDLFVFVKMSGAAPREITLCDTDGEQAIGVVTNKPRAGMAATVELGDILKVRKTAVALNAGALITVSATGRAVEAATGDFVVGTCVKGSAGTAGDEIVEVLMGNTHVAL